MQHPEKKTINFINGNNNSIIFMLGVMVMGNCMTCREIGTWVASLGICIMNPKLRNWQSMPFNFTLKQLPGWSRSEHCYLTVCDKLNWKLAYMWLHVIMKPSEFKPEKEHILILADKLDLQICCIKLLTTTPLLLPPLARSLLSKILVTLIYITCYSYFSWLGD